MFLAGFIDSLAGGGGIITLPAYLIFGINPAQLLGTNKLSSCMGTTISAWKFKDRIKISRKLLLWLMALALGFSVVGAAMTLLIDPKNLKFVILLVIPIVAAFVITNKNLGATETRQHIGIKKSNKAAQRIAASVACYDGFLGPGTGTMLAVFLSKYAGFDLVQSTAIAKVLNLCSNLFSLIFFLMVGAVNIKLGLMMGMFNIAGNSLGVYVGKRRGAKIIRPLIILVCIMIACRVIYDLASN